MRVSTGDCSGCAGDCAERFEELKFSVINALMQTGLATFEHLDTIVTLDYRSEMPDEQD